MNCSLYAGFWDQVKEKLLLGRLTGGNKFIAHKRNVDTKDPLFPIEVLNDGFKIIRIYQDFPGIYTVEWTWRAQLKNKSSRAVEMTFEYKLLDKDAFLVASNKEDVRRLAAGETITLENTDHLPYETAKRITNSNWHIKYITLPN